MVTGGSTARGGVGGWSQTLLWDSGKLRLCLGFPICRVGVTVTVPGSQWWRITGVSTM